MLLYANNPSLKTWLAPVENSDFPIQNIPFGIIQTTKGAHVATRIYDTVIDLYVLAEAGCFADLGIEKSVFANKFLNDFIALGKEKTLAVRDAIAKLLSGEVKTLQDNIELQEIAFSAAVDATMLLPIQIGDYTDFYSSREHATNVGTMFRDPNNALLPNWLHLPVGYHGRASSITVSGTPVVRPYGQLKLTEDAPTFQASTRVDFELEMAFVVGKENPLGKRVSTKAADDYIFGLALFNDWSARDVQTWEYVPLGPFLAKNFASTLSPWIVVLEALEPLRVATPKQEPTPLSYLQFEGLKNYDIQLEVDIQPQGAAATTVCRSNFKYMYWNMAQQLAHHTVNGCNMNIGDLCASGTISGPTPDSFGSMLELAWKGTKPIPMSDGTERKFILDNDTVNMRGFGITPDGIRIGFGEAKAQLLPAIPYED